MTALSSSALKILKDAALAEARQAASEDEVPVGAVIFHSVSGKIISSAHNRHIQLLDPTAHAEILAIRKACQVLSEKRLDGYSVFVTLQPCAMCMGALREAHIDSVFYVAPDLKTGDYEFKSVQKLEDDEEEIGLLKDFFKRKRKA